MRFRSLSFLEKFFESKVPEMSLLPEDYELLAQVNVELQEYINLLDASKLREALRQVLSISKLGNQYFQAQKPWTLNKDEEQ